MIKKFTKRQLLDQCGFSVDETKTILEYQKKLPILVENDNSTDDFPVNAKDLWEQLGKPQGTLWNWINRKILKRKTKGGNLIFKENVDYFTTTQKCVIANTGGFKEITYYMLSIDCAKNVSMMENTDNGALCRRYFILMENAVKKNTEWELIRHPLRQGYKQMQKALDDYTIRMIQRNADDWDYKLEADALNIIATGFKAQSIRNYVGCQDSKTRDSLTTTYNEYLMKLQEWNILFLSTNMNRYERYEKLKEFFDTWFSDAVPIKNDIEMNKIIENKNNFLLKEKEKLQR